MNKSKGQCRDIELAEVFAAISAVSQRLACKLLILSANERKRENSIPGIRCCGGKKCKIQ